VVVEVDELLIAAGRRREDLHYLNEDTEHCWTLNRVERPREQRHGPSAVCFVGGAGSVRHPVSC